MRLADLSPDGQEVIVASRELAAGAAVQPMNRPTPMIARSISQPVWESLQRAPLEGKVLAVFRQTCLLLLPGDNVVVLVLPEIGNGPLNIVLERLEPTLRWGQSGVFSLAEPGMTADLVGGGLRIGEMEVTLGGAVTWEPQPSWERLRQDLGRIENWLPFLRTYAQKHSPEGSLLSLVAAEPDSTAREQESVRASIVAAQEAFHRLLAGWAGDLSELQSGGRRLAGLGGGLTPAGDDFLTGVMLWAWLAHPAPQRFCRCLLESSAAHTTLLSAAFLRAAAKGECSAAWHNLLAALDGGLEHEVAEAVTEAVSFGHTSGADTLAGFVWMGLASGQTEITHAVGDSQGSSPIR